MALDGITLSSVGLKMGVNLEVRSESLFDLGHKITYLVWKQVGSKTPAKNV